MHNVAKEFSADDIFEKKATLKHKLAKMMKKKDKLGALGTTMDKNDSKIELVSKSPELKPTTETTPDIAEAKPKDALEGEWAV